MRLIYIDNDKPVRIGDISSLPVAGNIIVREIDPDDFDQDGQTVAVSKGVDDEELLWLHPAYIRAEWREDPEPVPPELDEDADAVKHLIVQGNPVDGFLYYGPFDTPEDAEDYVVKYDNGQSWWRVKMTRQM